MLQNVELKSAPCSGPNLVRQRRGQRLKFYKRPSWMLSPIKVMLASGFLSSLLLAVMAVRIMMTVTDDDDDDDDDGGGSGGTRRGR